jgi:hypothetical protein
MGELIADAIVGIAIALISGGVGSLITLRVDKRNKELDAVEKFQKIALGFVTPLETRVKKLESSLKRSYEFTQQLLGGIRQLVEQLQGYGMEPVWTPDDIPEDDWPPVDMSEY